MDFLLAPSGKRYQPAFPLPAPAGDALMSGRTAGFTTLDGRLYAMKPRWLATRLDSPRLRANYAEKALICALTKQLRVSIGEIDAVQRGHHDAVAVKHAFVVVEQVDQAIATHTDGPQRELCRKLGLCPVVTLALTQTGSTRRT